MLWQVFSRDFSVYFVLRLIFSPFAQLPLLFERVNTAARVQTIIRDMNVCFSRFPICDSMLWSFDVTAFSTSSVIVDKFTPMMIMFRVKYLSVLNKYSRNIQSMRLKTRLVSLTNYEFNLIFEAMRMRNRFDDVEYCNQMVESQRCTYFSSIFGGDRFTNSCRRLVFRAFQFAIAFANKGLTATLAIISPHVSSQTT